jgi:serpin B
MKKLLLILSVALCALCGRAEPVPADDILEFVRSKLPGEPVKLTGSLKVKAKNGFTKANLPVAMELDWGAAQPTAAYTIDKESLTITWQDSKPIYAFSNEKNTPTSDILGTGITWADLSFSVLWWPGSKLIDEARKINRDCYVVDVPVPNTPHTMRLWIEQNMGMLLEVKTLDAEMKELTRMKIVSIKKMDGMWVAKDLEIRDKQTGTKTTLQISDLEWKNPGPAAEAFDPAEAVNAFAADLYGNLAAEDDGNICLSPYSISSALSMTYGGAAGLTAEQMNEVLHFGGPDATHPAFSYLRRNVNAIQKPGHIQLNTANALWPQEGYLFLPDYLALIREFYAGEIHPVDYATDPERARQQINSWVEEQTNERIQNLIKAGSLTPLTRLMLVNAIYFKGNWASQFKEADTRPAPFTLADGSTVEVPMMSQTADFRLARTEKLLALELPYEGGDLSMIILLPDRGEALTLPPMDTLEFREMEVGVQLPKFKLESSFNLGGTLAAMGMPAAFSRNADFSGMDGAGTLIIDEVVHKVFVEVNEEGTEAAAATGVGMRLTSMPQQFIADRPFLFLIRENKTGTMLFMGRVMDPST